MGEKYEFILPEEDDAVDLSQLDHIMEEFSQEDDSPSPAQPEEAPCAPAIIRRKKNPFKVLLICCICVVLAAAIAVGVFYLGWQRQVHNSQLNEKSEEAFSLLFRDPDWDLLYTMAKIPDSAFEGREAFSQYMSQVAGGETLSYMLLPRETADAQSYAVFFGTTAVAEFTMNYVDGSIPDWVLGEVSLLAEKNQHVTIYKSPTDTAFINGTAVDSSYIIRTVSTLAEDFLPEGTHGYRMEQLYVPNLLLEPEVVVLNSAGMPVEMVYDSESCSYTPKETQQQPIGDEHIQFALDAAKASAAFAVRANTFTELRQFFDPNSPAYAQISAAAPLLDGCASFSFDPSATAVTNYRSYGNDMFSATVTLKLDAVLENGDARSFDFSWNYLYQQNFAGNFQIIEISKLSFHTLREQVRLSFLVEDKEVASFMVATGQSILQLPQIDTPAGMEFAGWAKALTQEDGSISYGIVFKPSANGVVNLDASVALEPMVLYAHFVEIPDF